MQAIVSWYFNGLVTSGTESTASSERAGSLGVRNRFFIFTSDWMDPQQRCPIWNRDGADWWHFQKGSDAQKPCEVPFFLV